MSNIGPVTRVHRRMNFEVRTTGEIEISEFYAKAQHYIERKKLIYGKRLYYRTGDDTV